MQRLGGADDYIFLVENIKKIHNMFFLRIFAYLKQNDMQFKDIAGQRDVINRLTEIIDSGRVSHAQLFLGATAEGSLQLALAYLQYLCCEHR